MKISQSCVEKLRGLVLLGIKSWDYCVIWKLSDDQRRIEFMGCCCKGAERSSKDEDEHRYVQTPCRDETFPHPRTNACDALDELPSSMILDSGNHTEALLTNKPVWLSLPNFTNMETVKTKVLIPVTHGLIELFVAKHVPEDHQTVEFVMAQCNGGAASWDPCFNDQTVLGSPGLNERLLPEKPFSGYLKGSNHFLPWMQPPPTTAAVDSLNLLPWELPQDQTRLCNSPLNFLGNPPQQQLESILSEKPTSFDSGVEHGVPDIAAALTNNPVGLHHSMAEYEKESVKQEMGRGDSLSDCSDQIEDDDDQKVASRSGRRNQSKNLVAERKRRKKLNDRLYSLRALVPKITKMDRASILGDAIEFVKELQKQVKDLQDELEETPEEEAEKQNGNPSQPGTQNQDTVLHGDHNKSPEGSGLVIAEQGNTRCSSSNKTSDASKHNPDSQSTDDKGQQMEVQVEVSQVNGNEFFVKIFCEHRAGGFVKLLEAMNSLGLEVTNANITTFRGLVLNVVKVEKRDSEPVQAEQVRESLIELTRNPTGGWSEPEATTEGGPADQQQQQHHHHCLHHDQQRPSTHRLRHRHHCR